MKRATSTATSPAVAKRYFNPRPREEGDALGSMCSLYISDFNPRPREEGDYMPNIPFSPATHFNPRPREEGDVIILL